MTVRWRVLLGSLWEAWPVWLTIGGIAAAWLTAGIPNDSLSAQIRYAGLILQVLGLTTVAYGLARMRRLFRRPSLVERTTSWLRHVAGAFRRPEPITIQPEAGNLMVMGGVSKIRLGAAEGAPLDKRVEVLEQNFRSLDSEVDELKSALNKEQANLASKIETERAERYRGDERLQKQLEEVGVGGVHLESMGLTWLVVGIVFATAPEAVVTVLGLFAPRT